jgi:hypothetical protein
VNGCGLIDLTLVHSMNPTTRLSPRLLCVLPVCDATTHCTCMIASFPALLCCIVLLILLLYVWQR